MATVNLLPDQPTIQPKYPFDPEDDCRDLHKAMQGLGMDEKAVVEIIANRSLEQRLKLIPTYKTMYGKDLISSLKSELSGPLENVVVALLQAPEIYDANSLHDALCGSERDEDTLIEIICSRSNVELQNIKSAYKHLFKSELEHVIAGDTSGYFERILIACLTGGRQEGDDVDLAKVQVDAKALQEAGPKRWGTDADTFISIFSMRSHAHLKVMFDEFKRLTSTDIEKVIQAEMGGNLEDSFLTLVKIARNRHAYFAERLYESVTGAGKKDHQLIRVVVTRCEKDLGNIKEEFQRIYGKRLESFILTDSSGGYKNILLAIVKQG